MNWLAAFTPEHHTLCQHFVQTKQKVSILNQCVTPVEIHMNVFFLPQSILLSSIEAYILLIYLHINSKGNN